MIKVEDSASGGDNVFEMVWYFENNELIYCSLDSEKSKSRAELLVIIAKGILEKLDSK